MGADGRGVRLRFWGTGGSPRSRRRGSVAGLRSRLRWWGARERSPADQNQSRIRAPRSQLRGLTRLGLLEAGGGLD
jgi:hypothetical protein